MSPEDINIDAMLSNAEIAAKWLKAVANPYRLMILCLLLDKELSVTEINEAVPLSQSALSQHLAVLRSEDLVDTRKSSQIVYYSLKNQQVTEVISILHRKFCSAQC
ncbi:winged helix-turn-helix transcriptional regulator [Shewanella yunxiaonensis]|uniref:Winged helix-turn-helix transcriptional regulator n=1 Tax=Shewanella yunxiaonensis TaxID=2829809 RepID=A0ABX7YUZ3_9GAMM|nr:MULTISPECIES: metalloregulator ArsR/SmtB family transcription factor [Shewanella]MDF0535363.1 metalloregulator ArsR/SmtB family transcription factor [Shewanella sp. A32]QUN05936.1 winged helix-turn-helix transcriptional regulator [Shewanella yunxiaonensis]